MSKETKWRILTESAVLTDAAVLAAKLDDEIEPEFASTPRAAGARPPDKEALPATTTTPAFTPGPDDEPRRASPNIPFARTVSDDPVA